MENLEQLVYLVGPKFLRQTTVLDDKNDTKLHRLYQSIKSGNLEDEESLAQSLFGISCKSPVYIQLKSKLRVRLINNLFLLEPNEPQFKSYAIAFQNCRKLFFAAEILYTKGARAASISLAEKAFRMSEKFQFTDIAEFTSSFLRNGFRVLGDKRKMKYYRAKSDIYFRKYLVEKEIQFIRSNLLDDIELNKGLGSEDFEFMKIQEQKLNTILERELSPLSMAFGYGSLCLIKEYQQKFEEIIEIADLAINKLSEFQFLPAIFLMSFYNNILTSAIALNDFGKGKKVVEMLNQKLTQIKGLNRIYLTTNYMVLSLRTANYLEAFKLFVETKSSAIWKKVPDSSKEQWELYGAYLYFLNAMNMLDVPKENFTGFRMGRFFNSIHHINKDKVGFNLALLILQIIYFLGQKKIDRVLDHLESLNSYNYRYLRKDESARSQYFVKMLLTLSDGNFHQVAVKRKSKKWVDLLDKEKTSISSEGLRSEFIPYDVLWEIILRSLDKKIVKTR